MDSGNSSKRPIITFGKYYLPDLRRTNLCFHPNEGIELTTEQRCLLNNVWSFYNIKQKVITCHSLAQYFSELNSRKLNLEKTFSNAHHIFHALDNSSPGHLLLRKNKLDIFASYKNIVALTG